MRLEARTIALKPSMGFGESFYTLREKVSWRWPKARGVVLFAGWAVEAKWVF
jgi:hypothetical protein